MLRNGQAMNFRQRKHSMCFDGVLFRPRYVTGPTLGPHSVLCIIGKVHGFRIVGRTVRIEVSVAVVEMNDRRS